MNKVLGGAVLLLTVVVIVQRWIYGGRVDPDLVELSEPDTVLVCDTVWYPDTSVWVEGVGMQEVDMDSLAEVWRDEWLKEWLAGRRDSVEADSGVRAKPELPEEAEIASLDTTIVGLCRLRVDYVLPPYDLWRLSVSERYEVRRTVTVKEPYAVPVYPRWSVEAVLLGGGLTGDDKYRVGIMGGLFYRRVGVVLGLDTQGYWLGVGYRWRL